MISLFELENGKVKPTIHCHTIVPLKKIMEEYPKEYLNIYSYLFYMSCHNEDLNPFASVPEIEKEEVILKSVGGTFSCDDKLIVDALKVTKKLYESTMFILYVNLKKSIEALAFYLGRTPITDGRDSNIMGILKAQKEFDAIRQSFNNVYKDFKEEQNITPRGGGRMAYDQ